MPTKNLSRKSDTLNAQMRKTLAKKRKEISSKIAFRDATDWLHPHDDWGSAPNMQEYRDISHINSTRYS